MDLKSEKIFNDNKDYILTESTKFYGIQSTDLTKLGSFESFVYEFRRNGKEYILKITHSLHRTINQVWGELEWLDFLAKNGVSVSPVAPSINSNLLEVIEMDESFFIVYSFIKANGCRPVYEHWNDQLFQTWGRAVGKMHRLTKEYSPSKPDYKRFEWFEDGSVGLEKHIPPDQKLVIQNYTKLMDSLNSFPRDRESYGLVHTDLHQGNFFIDNGEITIFDTDDCHYNWFAFDLAIPLYYVLRDANINQDDKSFARNFLRNFLIGYREENKLEDEWIERIPYFMKLRDYDLYTIIHAEKAFTLNEWCSRFMEGRQEKLEKNISVIDLDFTQFV
jgi:amicoumacin kinase